MASLSIYRSAKGQAEILSLYDEAVARLDQRIESRTVATRYGATHVLETGPATAPPVVVWHGGNFLNPYSLAWVLPGLRDWRVYAHWIVDLLDGLGQERVLAEAGLPMPRYRRRPSHERLGVFLSEIDVTVRAQDERGEGRHRGRSDSGPAVSN